MLSSKEFDKTEAELRAGHLLTRTPCIKWTCKDCGAEGTIDPVNEFELAYAAFQEAHRILSPDCPNSKPLDAT